MTLVLTRPLVTRLLALLLAVLCSLFTSTRSQAQASGVTASSAHHLESDPVAVETLTTFLKNSGGEPLWSGVTSSTETFSISQSDGSTSQNQSFTDNWSQKVPRYRHTSLNGITPRETHDGTSTFSVQLQGQQVNLPEIDRARVIAARLPAAAAVVILSAPEYIVVPRHGSPCPASSRCIDIVRRQAFVSDSLPEQRWIFSTYTGQLTGMELLASVVGGARAAVYTKFEYQSFGLEAGRSVPQIILVGEGTHQRTMTLSTIAFNPSN